MGGHGAHQCLKVKPVKNMLCIEFLFIDVFQSLLENLLELIKVRLARLEPVQVLTLLCAVHLSLLSPLDFALAELGGQLLILVHLGDVERR